MPRSRIRFLKHLRPANHDGKLRPQLGTSLLRSAARLRNWVTSRSLLPLSPHGNGCSVRNTCLEPLSLSTIGLPNDLIACTSSTPRRARKLGGRFLTTQNGHCSPN